MGRSRPAVTHLHAGPVSRESTAVPTLDARMI